MSVALQGGISPHLKDDQSLDGTPALSFAPASLSPLEKKQERDRGCIKHWSQGAIGTLYIAGAAYLVTIGVNASRSLLEQYLGGWFVMPHFATDLLMASLGMYYIKKFVPRKALEENVDRVEAETNKIARQNLIARVEGVELREIIIEGKEQLEERKVASESFEMKMAHSTQEFDRVIEGLKSNKDFFFRQQKTAEMLKDGLKELSQMLAAFNHADARIEDVLALISRLFKTLEPETEKVQKEINLLNQTIERCEKECAILKDFFEEKEGRLQQMHDCSQEDFIKQQIQLKEMNEQCEELKFCKEQLHQERLILERQLSELREIMSTRDIQNAIDHATL